MANEKQVKTQKFKSEEEFNQHEDAAIDLARKSSNLSTMFRQKCYEIYERGGPEICKKPAADIAKEFTKKLKGAHRSYLNRLHFAGKGDYDYKLPPGELKEAVHRELRLKVKPENVKEVIELAFSKKGGYEKIQTRDILEIAREHDFLKPEFSGAIENEVADESLHEAGDDEEWDPEIGSDSRSSKKPNIESGIQREGKDLKPTLKPLYDRITSDPRNIAPVRRYLEVCGKDQKLAGLLAELSKDDRAILIERLSGIRN